MIVNCVPHGSPKWPKYEENCVAQTPYFLKRVYPSACKNGKMKMFHSYQKKNHKTSYSGAKAIMTSKISIENQKFYWINFYGHMLLA